jgi:hypothetical protein
MKLTKSQLKQIIVEEIGNLQEKNDPDEIRRNMDRADAARRAAKEKAKKDKKGIQKEDATGEVDKTPYMDMTQYELDDLSTDKQMIVLLKEVVAQLKTLNHQMTPAKGLGASEVEKAIAQSQVAEKKEHPGTCEEAHPDQSHEGWEA